MENLVRMLETANIEG